MKIFFSHQSALFYWLSPHGRRTVTNGFMDSLPAPSLAQEHFHVDWLNNYGIPTDDIHVTIANPELRTHTAGVSFHVAPGPVPARFYERIAGEWWVSSPELTFWQMAVSQTIPESVKLGYELCAAYRKNEFSPGGLEHSEPLTTAAALRKFGAAYGSRRGAKNARAALQYVADNAASPMEVAVSMLLTVPRMYGGYGLPPCKLNPPTLAKSVLTRQAMELHGDLVWEDRRVIVEYESNEFHLDAEKFAQDAERRNALQASGWTVMTLTWGQVRDERRCDEAAAQLARLLGVRQTYTPRGMLVKRAVLRNLVLPEE